MKSKPTEITIYREDEDDRYTITMDLRWPLRPRSVDGEWDPSNTECADALRLAFPGVEFDAENAKFFAYASELDVALAVVAAAHHWIESQGIR